MLPQERQELLKQVRDKLPKWAPFNRSILIGLRGSDAHGTKLEKGPNDIDDVDVFVVMVHPLEYYLGLDGYNKKHEHWDSAGDDLDILVYDVRKFIHLVSGSNPNVLNWLFNRSEDYLYIDPLGQLLIDNGKMFLSQEAFPRLFGYAYSQLERMRADKKYLGYMGAKRKQLVDEYGYDLKNAGHCVRLLLMGIELAQFGTFSSYRPEHDIKLITDIKKGKYTIDDVLELTEGLKEQFNRVSEKCDHILPKNVDTKKASRILSEIILDFTIQKQFFK